jgi:WD40 repeat protein
VALSIVEGRQLAGALVLWDLKAGRITVPIAFPVQTSSAVAYSPDSARILVSGQDGSIGVYDGTGAPLPPLLGHASPVVQVGFGPDGRSVYSCAEHAAGSNEVLVWDTARGQGERWLRGPARGRDAHVSVAISPDGSLIVAAAGNEKRARVWDARTGREVHVIDGALGAILAFSPDGRRLATCDGNRRLSVWDTQTWAVVASWPHPARPWQRSAVFSPDSRVLAGGVENGVVGWEAETGREVFRLTCPPAALPTHHSMMSDVQFSPDGSALAANQDGILNVWGLEDRTLRARFGDQKNGLAGVAGSAFFPAGDRIVTSKNEVMTVRDARTGRVLFTVPALRARAERLAFLPGGDRLVGSCRPTGSSSSLGLVERQTVRVWDPNSWREVLELPFESGEFGLAVSADGNRIAAGGSDGLVRVWEAPRDAEGP